MSTRTPPSTGPSFQGRPYYFCSAGCQTKFVADPGEVLSPADGEAAPSPCRRARSTPARCIPRSGRSGPGSCPICGMALEPVVATAETGPNPELADMTRRFWIGARPGRAGRRPGDGRPSARPRARASPRRRPNWVQLALATPVVLWAGWPFFVRGWAVAREPQPQHVHADRHGHRRRLALQRRRDARARHLPAGLPRARRRGGRLLRGGRGHHRPGAARAGAGAARPRAAPAARSGRCSTSRPRRRGASRPDGTDEEVAARRSRRSATGCACARARRCRSTAWSSKAAARSTSRWSPASRCR